ncbi:hypothetical protein HB900_14585 [Listeria booriae]|uniref:hypothetical protein n=1 Tax=Listeria booriae TaxID=1552123 RepID=UPI0016251B49|nr:hypothetical protein [Listeria booriae]MBC1575695.1 hypothetical protein [Listeria booriae]
MVDGLVRDFSDKEKVVLEQIIDDIKGQDTEWYNSVGDWFNDRWYDVKGLTGNLDIDGYVNDITNYHKQVLDQKNTDKAKINTIFQAVQEVDSTFKSSIDELNERLKAISNTLFNIADLINIDNSDGFAFSKSPTSFTDMLVRAGEGSFSYFRSKLVTVDEFGIYTYNWSEISAIFQKSPDDVTMAEYLALSYVLNTMNILEKDESGNITSMEVDVENFEIFINMAYTSVTSSNGFYMQGPNYIDTTNTLSPVFQRFSDFYSDSVSALLSQNGGVLFDTKNPNSLESQFLNNLMVKGNILNNISNYCETLMQHQNLNEITGGLSSIKSLSIELSRVNDRNGFSGYHIGTEGYIGDYLTDGVTVYDFNEKNTHIFVDNTKKVAEGLRRDKGGELLSSMGQTTYNELIGQTVNGIVDVGKLLGMSVKAVPVINGSYIVGKFTVDSAIRNIEIDMNNKKVDEILKDQDNILYFEAMRAGASVSEFQGYLSCDNVTIYQTGLQIYVNAYNEKHSTNQIDMDQLENDFNTMLNTGEISRNLENYQEWVNGNSQQLRGHSNALQSILTEYGDDRFQVLDDLTPNQINELESKLKNSTYNMNLG